MGLEFTSLRNTMIDYKQMNSRPCCTNRDYTFQISIPLYTPSTTPPTGQITRIYAPPLGENNFFLIHPSTDRNNISPRIPLHYFTNNNTHLTMGPVVHCTADLFSYITHADARHVNQR